MARGGAGHGFPRGARPQLAEMRLREVVLQLGQGEKRKPSQKSQGGCGKVLLGHLLQPRLLVSTVWAAFKKKKQKNEKHERGLAIGFPPLVGLLFPFLSSFWCCEEFEAINCRMSFQMV